MSRLTRGTCTTVLAALLAMGGTVSAGNGSTPNEPTEGPPEIEADVETPDVVVPGGTETDESPIPCRWTRSPATAEHAENLNTIFEVLEIVIQTAMGGSFVVQVTFYSEDGILHRFDDSSGRYEYLVTADCTNATDSNGWSTGDTDWWIATDPDPVILLPGTRREATRPLTFPVPDLSPAAEGVVNLGMWLAVEPAGPFSVEARIGPRVWARTTATLATTTFDPGNGDDPVVCDGVGTPIPESALESIDAGPCGYVYGEASEGNSMTITATWHVTWELSDGRTGRDDDIVIPTVVPYDVVEIQTVGTGN